MPEPPSLIVMVIIELRIGLSRGDRIPVISHHCKALATIGNCCREDSGLVIAWVRARLAGLLVRACTSVHESGRAVASEKISGRASAVDSGLFGQLWAGTFEDRVVAIGVRAHNLGYADTHVCAHHTVACV